MNYRQVTLNNIFTVIFEVTVKAADDSDIKSQFTIFNTLTALFLLKYLNTNKNETKTFFLKIKVFI